MKRILLSLLALLFLMLLLLSPATSLEGARNGLLLWAYTVLPTLLPFMIGTGMIVSLGAVHLVMRPFSPLLSFFFHFSEPAGFAFSHRVIMRLSYGCKNGPGSFRKRPDHSHRSKLPPCHLQSSKSHVHYRLHSTGKPENVPGFSTFSAVHFSGFPLSACFSHFFPCPALLSKKLQKIQTISVFQQTTAKQTVT